MGKRKRRCKKLIRATLSTHRRAMKIKGIQLSLKQQSYIETIYELCKTHSHAHTKDIADKMGIKMASVTEAIQGLAEKGIINYQARLNMTLTQLGEDIALELDKRHLALADFFKNILCCSNEYSEDIACKIEHVIDDQFLQRLTDFVTFLRNELPANGTDPVEEFKKRYKDLK